MKKKTLMALCLALAAVCIFCACSGEQAEDYRMIQVLEVTGSVSVERTDMGTMDAYAGMRLQSGDRITVAEESWLKIQMDEDKFALVEPGSSLRLEASGSSADSKTAIHLDAGAISSRLEEKLSDGSSYEVKTPNSTMAVRGTVFRVEVKVHVDGVSVTDISVYDGSVASRLIYPDGSEDGEARAVLIVDGTTAQVWSNTILSKYEETDTEIDLTDLQLKTLHFLQESYAAGKELSISEEAVAELIDALEKTTQTDPATEPTTEPATEPTEPTETTAATEPAETKATKPYVPSTKESDADEDADEDENVDADEDADEDEPETVAPTTTETTAPPETTAQYTVTFQYSGTTFATQTVLAGGTATAPILQPTASGSWDVTLPVEITADTTITWIASP